MVCTGAKTYRVADITHLVLAHLSADKQSLASCSLVCSDWTFIARLHLFATVRLYGERAEDFSAFLQTPGAVSVKRHIRSLRWTEAEDAALDIDSLCRVVKSLPRVRTLYLTFNRFSARPSSFPYDRVQAYFASIRRLSIRCRLRLNGRQNNVQPLADFLTMFEVDELNLDTHQEPFEPETVDPCRVSYFPLPSRPLRVGHLVVSNGCAVYQEADIFARILGPFNDLQSISYHVHSSEDVRALGSLLRSSGRQIRSLTLLCDPHRGQNAFHGVDWHKLNLVYCPNLEAISLPNFWNSPHHLVALFDVLACDVEGLRSLSLGVSKVSSAAPVNMTDAQWDKAENLLRALSSAVTIDVNLQALTDLISLKARIQGKWASLSGSGRLELVHSNNGLLDMA
ncbi:hypothetical protein BC835DRAFT_1413277 [Cytidiella melzeri]|nr:hypothetical protein BC835DRAFT_1413277 [Cytidiella melzeri]